MHLYLLILVRNAHERNPLIVLIPSFVTPITQPFFLQNKNPNLASGTWATPTPTWGNYLKCEV